MNGHNRQSKTRSQIALWIMGSYIGVPVLALLAVLLRALSLEDWTALMGEWHKYSTPVATCVLGYYFGSSDMVRGRREESQQEAPSA